MADLRVIMPKIGKRRSRRHRDSRCRRLVTREEAPDLVGRVERRRRRIEEAREALAARPRMAAALDRDQLDLAAAAARRIARAPQRRRSARSWRSRRSRRGGARSRSPSATLRTSWTRERLRADAAIERQVAIGAAVDDEHRHRPRRPAAIERGHLAGDDGDRRRRGRRACTRPRRPSCRRSRCRSRRRATRSIATIACEVVEQRRDERHLVDALLHRLAAAGAGVPGPSLPAMPPEPCG